MLISVLRALIPAMIRAMPNTTSNAKSKSPKTVAINVQLPIAVHRKLRLKALHQEMTLAEAVTAAVSAWTR
jgi:hypothetical protein